MNKEIFTMEKLNDSIEWLNENAGKDKILRAELIKLKRLKTKLLKIRDYNEKTINEDGAIQPIVYMAMCSGSWHPEYDYSNVIQIYIAKEREIKRIADNAENISALIDLGNNFINEFFRCIRCHVDSPDQLYPLVDTLVNKIKDLGDY